MEWTAADIAGIVSAVVAIGGAISARSEKRKAEAAAQDAADSQAKAAEAQSKAASAQRKLARTAKIDSARAANRLVVDFDGKKTVRVTNPMSYRIQRLDVWSTAIVNARTTIHYLEPLEPEEIFVEDTGTQRDLRKHQEFRFEWRDQNGERVEQRWKFTDDD